MSSRAGTWQHAMTRGRQPRLVGTSRAVESLAKQIAIAGRGRFPVWIYGDDGVNKELVARLIHEASEWASGGFFSLDASVIPASLLARELFGAEEGAISTLPTFHEGAFGRNQRGTVVVDGAAALPKSIQQALARALDTSLYERIGGSTEISLESRLIAAGERNIDALVSEGTLLPEFAERLRLLEIQVPSLRDRTEDILPIAGEILAEIRSEIEDQTKRPCPVRGFAAGALERLVNHPWPGNERELREQIRSAVGVAKGADIQSEDLMFGWDGPDQVPPFREAKRAFEREYVVRILRMCRGNISQAARIARKDRKDFYDVMKRNSIDPQTFRN